MPTVNSIAAPTTAASGSQFTGRIDSSVISPEAQSAPGKQIAETGAVIAKQADTMLDAQNTAMKAASDLRVAGALNQVRQATLDAAYDKDTGYLNLKGDAALSRPNGVSLPDEYGQKINSQISTIAGSLGNDYQKAEFQKQAGELATTFRGDVQKHVLTEYTALGTSTADGTIKLAQQEASLNWNNPDRIATSIESLKQASYNKAKLTGMSANEAQAVSDEAASKVHSSVIQSALENNNPTYANSYFQNNKGGMTADDIVKVQGQMNTKMDAYTAQGAVDATDAKYKPTYAPTDMDRMTNITLGAESNGQRYGADGNLLISAKGAKGEMQVMDATNTQPGFGVIPAKDNSPEERARVGRDYLNAMVKQYGDPAKAWAAYNAGPGAVDDAVKKADAEAKTLNSVKGKDPSTYNIPGLDKMSGNWLDHLPAETQGYVNSNMAKLNAGGGRQTMPTKLDYVNNAVSILGPNPRPEAEKMAREAAEKRYDDTQASVKQQGQNALDTAQQELLQNGGDFTKLSPGAMSGLTQYDPDNYKKATEFAKAVRDPVATDPAEYAKAISYPDALGKMSEADFLQYSMTNFSAADREKVINLRKTAMTGTNDNSAGAINNEAVNTILKPRLAELGIDSNPKTGDTEAWSKLGNIQQFTRDAIYKQQAALGRKMSSEEVESTVDSLFRAEAQGDRNWFMKFILPASMSTSSENLLNMGAGDIPSTDASNLRKQFAARGVNSPSDNDMLRAYWFMKAPRNGK